MMSEPELRRHLESITTMVTTTANDVKWIREGMRQGHARLNDHGKRLGRLERWRTYIVGIGAALSLGLFGSHGFHGD